MDNTINNKPGIRYRIKLPITGVVKALMITMTIPAMRVITISGGTRFPFLQIGAPFFKSEDIIEKLNLLKVDGAEFQPVSFIPEGITEMATNPKFEGKTCFGIKIKIIDPNKFESVKFGVKLLFVLTKLYGSKVKFSESSFDRLAGTNILRQQINNKMKPDKIFASWQKELTKFNKIKNQYLLY